MIKLTLILQGVPPTKFRRAKKAKIRRDFWQLSTLIANVSGMRRLVENLNSTWSTTFHSLLGEKNLGELWSTNQKVIDAHVEPPNWTFSGDYNSALGGAGPSNFYTPYNSLKCISSLIWGAGRPHVGLCPILLLLLDIVGFSDRRVTGHACLCSDIIVKPEPICNGRGL